MCSRYELRSPPVNIIERFGLSPLPAGVLDQMSGPEIRPTNAALVVGTDLSPEVLPWGLKVSWQKSPVINARVETVMEKPTFKGLLDRRVLIPASAYFEWRTQGRDKIKTRISLADNEVFAMAGLRADDRFVVLTCAPAPPIAHIHTRMPVILEGSAEQAWLNPDNTFESLFDMLGPFEGSFETLEIPGPAPKQADLFG